MVVGANFVLKLMGCRMQHLLRTSMIAKHTLGLLLVFFLVVLANPTSSQETVFVNVGVSLLVYAWFLMTTRSPFGLALVSILLLLGVYLSTAYRQKLADEKEEEGAHRVDLLQKYMAIAAFLISTVGFTAYTIEKRLEYGEVTRQENLPKLHPAQGVGWALTF